jgi:dCMP deaminase
VSDLDLSSVSFKSWDQFLMTLAFFVGMKSKDQSTRVGAVITTPTHRVVSVGYDGFPKNIRDDVPERHARPKKYFWTCHAERNALDNAGATRACVRGCIMYTPWIPCSGCARGIIQNDIIEVVHYYSFKDAMGSQFKGREDWRREIEESVEMLREAGVKLRHWNGELFHGLYQVCGEEISVPGKGKTCCSSRSSSRKSSKTASRRS